MVDRVSSRKRSDIMRAVRGKNTKPELIVRSVAHHLGLRFKLHDSKLPGQPDLVFPRWETVLFVHGCFWHRHKGCAKATTPKSNIEFWEAKFSANQARDHLNIRDLKASGWRVLVIWQCQTKSNDEVAKFLVRNFSLDQSSTCRNAG